MFGLGLQELVVILVIVLIIFGAGKLPSVFGALGKGLRNFKQAASGEDTDSKAQIEVKQKDTPREPRQND